MGKSILLVRPSSAGEIVSTDLGFKPIHFLISQHKLYFVSSVLRDDFPGSGFVQVLMREQLSRKTSPFYLDLLRRFEPLGVAPELCSRLTIKALSSYWSAQILHRIPTLSFLASLPTPRSWWCKQSYVCEDSWSQTLSEFHCSNARLGNRDDSLALVAVPYHQNRVVVCPLCLQGHNYESHL